MLLVRYVDWLESGVGDHLHALVFRDVQGVPLALETLPLLNDDLALVLLLFFEDSKLTLHATDGLVNLLRWLKKVIYLGFFLNYFELLNFLLTYDTWG